MPFVHFQSSERAFFTKCVGCGLPAVPAAAPSLPALFLAEHLPQASEPGQRGGGGRQALAALSGDFQTAVAWVGWLLGVLEFGDPPHPNWHSQGRRETGGLTPVSSFIFLHGPACFGVGICLGGFCELLWCGRLKRPKRVCGRRGRAGRWERRLCPWDQVSCVSPSAGWSGTLPGHPRS